MKNYKRSLLALSILALGFNSCKNNTENEPTENEKVEAVDTENYSAQMGMTNDIEFKETKTAELFDQYEGIKNALVATNAEAAAEHAVELVAVSDGEIKAAASKIATETDVNIQREAFSELTVAMEMVLDGSLENGKIYKQFCPMAFEGKGDYWFSDSETIRNPYFGDKMLKCGRVEKTIQ